MNNDLHIVNGGLYPNRNTRKSSDSLELKERHMHENSYSIRESSGYFGRLEGEVNFPLFGCRMIFHIKTPDAIYAGRCAEYFENITADNLKEHTALYACLEALVQYVSDLLEERGGEFELGDAFIDENSSVDDLLKIIKPESLMFERDSYCTEEECPIAYSIKFSLAPVPDEVMEIALHADTPVYVGEFSGVSPWNDKLLKKKWNYARDI